MSRFGRDHIEVGYYTEMVFPMWNIRFIAVNDNFDSANFKGTTGGMEFSVKNLFNQLYSYDISKKVKSSLEMCRQAGKFVASQTPYGYMKDPADKHKLIIDERYAPAIRIIFEMAAKGKNGVKIAKYLNENGYSSSRRETPKRKTTLNHDCQSVYIATETAHNAVLSTVKEACWLMLDSFELIQSQEETQTQGIKKAVTDLESEKAKLEKAPFTLYKEYKAGKITKEDFTAQKGLAAERLTKVEEEIAARTAQLTISEKPTVNKQDLLNCSQLAEYDGKILSNIIERINVYAPDKIEIIFKCDDFY